MARICPLFSSSSGNSTYIDTPNGGFLVDAGASFKNIVQAVTAAGCDFSDLRAVAVTHEHSDHIAGLKTVLKKTGVPLIASPQTLETLAAADKIPAETVTIPAEAETLDLVGVGITHIPTSHDCVGSGGYSFTLPDGRRIAVCTDLGVVTDAVRTALTGCSAVLIESNHDVSMLQRGPYPPSLKMRILSEMGHLSNVACATELPALLKSGTTRFILGHLSQKNNLPMLALSTAKASLADAGAEFGKDYLLNVARPNGNEVVLL
ncbi:MAG: MBL fold metallo-hydrolase [Clostridia bacterium]|nr:MBL fold metallo-hydrolase [Clostridia bacterium]